jgi:hypothetical protein
VWRLAAGRKRTRRERTAGRQQLIIEVPKSRLQRRRLLRLGRLARARLVGLPAQEAREPADGSVLSVSRRLRCRAALRQNAT